MNDNELNFLFDSTIKNDLFAHAYLIYDIKECTKRDIILDIVKNYLNISNQVYSNLLDHPDIIVFNPETSIKIQDIHTIQNRIKYGPTNFTKSFVIIENCHLFSTQAANAFLKTLEEPIENIVFFLTTSNIQQVISTIKSRCICIYSTSNNSVDNLESIEFESFKSLNLIDKLELLSSKISSKEELSTQLIYWIEFLYKKDPIQNNQIINFLTNTIKRLQFNVNLRLQLEYLCLGI